VSAEVLYASDLNAEFSNVLDNAISLISPLTGSLDVNGKDLTAIDELAFSDAAGSASAAGRLRRNVGALTWADGAADIHQIGTNWGIGTVTFGTSADNVLAQFAGTAPSTAPADAVQKWVGDRAGAGTATQFVRTEDSGITERALAVMIQTSDTTERTTTATSTADLSTHVVNIPAGDAFTVTGLVRKTAGHASAALLGIKINGVAIVANFAVTSTVDQAELGHFSFGLQGAFGQARATNYTQGSTLVAITAASLATMNTYQNTAQAAVLPTAAITAIIITGHVTNALNTLAVKDITVYRVARS
jgi:hypothetical protein